MIAGKLTKALRKLLYWQGCAVADKPLLFLIGPLILTTVLSYGFVFRTKLNSSAQNVRAMFIPKNGFYAESQAKIQEVFNHTFNYNLDPLNGFTFSIIVSHANQSQGIFNENFINHYLWLRESIEGIVVTDDLKRSSNYHALCVKQLRRPRDTFSTEANKCFPDLFQLLTYSGLSGYRDVKFLQYPTARLRVPDTDQHLEFDLKFSIGSVALRSNGYILNASAAMMNFNLQPPPAIGEYTAAKLVIGKWEREFVNHLNQWDPPDGIELSWFSRLTFKTDLRSINESLLPLLPQIVGVILCFSLFATSLSDWVLSKPLVAIGGVLTAIISIVSGFGMLMIIQVKFVNLVYVAPFLILAVGVDDMFLLLACWRKLDSCSSVQDRLSRTYADAAVSITITSLTNFFSFLLGWFTPFPAVRYFCLYTSVCIMFAYLYQITFFSACMALSGRREAANRHCILLVKLQTPSQAGTFANRLRISSVYRDQPEQPAHRSLCYRAMWTGGIDRNGSCRSSECTLNSESTNSGSQEAIIKMGEGSNYCCFRRRNRRNYEPVLNLICKYYYGPLLEKSWMQAFVFITYAVYIVSLVYGFLTLEVGLNFENLVPDTSPTKQYLQNYDSHFSNYSWDLEVLINADIDYADTFVQSGLFGLLHDLMDSDFTTVPHFWLIDYLSFLAERRNPPISDRGLFEESLRALFLENPEFATHSLHVKWENGPDVTPRIVASRFFVGVKNVQFGKEWDFYHFVQETLKKWEGQLGISLYAHHRAFEFGAQQSFILPTTLRAVCGAAGVMVLIAYILIPHPLCSVLVGMSIISINAGVVGFFSYVQMKLDVITMVTILMSVGISVDFVAHVAYAYAPFITKCHKEGSSHSALDYLGAPILNGGLSSILGMLVLLSVPAYMTRTFVTTLLLVIIFSLYHGLAVLPVVLTLFVRYRRVRSPLVTQSSRCEIKKTSKGTAEERHGVKVTASSGKVFNCSSVEMSARTANSLGSNRIKADMGRKSSGRSVHQRTLDWIINQPKTSHSLSTPV